MAGRPRRRARLRASRSLDPHHGYCPWCSRYVLGGKKHARGCPHAEKTPSGGWGVFPHAEWVNDQVKLTGGGFVVRPLEGSYVPYMRMTPLRVFKSKAAADKYSDKLSGY